MEDNLLRESVKKVIKETLGVNDDFSNDADFAKDLKMDSITLMEVLMSFEDEFDIQIKDEDSALLTSVNETVNFIKSLKKNG